MSVAEHVANNPAGPVTLLPAIPEPSSADEAHHRIANSLQLLAAMVSAEVHRVTDPIAVAALDMTMRRISAIAGVQRMLYQSHDGSTVDLGGYLDDLGTRLEQSCADAGDGRHVRVVAEAVDVSPEDATAVGVIVSELVANACKHAYPAGMPGDVHVALRAIPSGGYVLDVSDRGRGMAADADARGTGLGSRVVAAMVRRLEGRFVWKDLRPGTHFTLQVGRR